VTAAAAIEQRTEELMQRFNGELSKVLAEGGTCHDVACSKWHLRDVMR
jgi:hypothetical protein